MKGNGGIPAQSDVKVMLAITMNHAGQVNVTGPIEDAILCFGLMEFAKTIITQYNQRAQVEQRLAVPPHLKPAAMEAALKVAAMDAIERAANEPKPTVVQEQLGSEDEPAKLVEVSK